MMPSTNAFTDGRNSQLNSQPTSRRSLWWRWVSDQVEKMWWATAQPSTNAPIARWRGGSQLSTRITSSVSVGKKYGAIAISQLPRPT
jgi:hypothetical protein